jgi:hypothetical protein
MVMLNLEDIIIDSSNRHEKCSEDEGEQVGYVFL